MVSAKLKNAIRLSETRQYRIAHRAGINPTTLSKILCGIEKVKHGDRRVIAVGEVMGINAEECFEPSLGKNNES